MTINGNIRRAYLKSRGVEVVRCTYRGSRRLAAAGAGLAFLLAIFSFTGCGDSGNGTVSGPTAGIVSRTTPGTVELIDARNDISGSQDMSLARNWVDLSWASVSQDASNTKFTMDLAGPVPDSMQSGVAGEWGFMIDIDQDGTPDWVIYASSSFKDGWTSGLYNPITKDRLSGQQFPGTFSHSDTKVELTVNNAAIGAAKEFKWFAFTNEYTKSAEGANVQAGDHIPDLGMPDNSADWLPYP